VASLCWWRILLVARTYPPARRPPRLRRNGSTRSARRPSCRNSSIAPSTGLLARDAPLRAAKVRVALLDLAHGEPPRLATSTATQPIYPASVVKFVYLMAAVPVAGAGPSADRGRPRSRALGDDSSVEQPGDPEGLRAPHRTPSPARARSRSLSRLPRAPARRQALAREPRHPRPALCESDLRRQRRPLRPRRTVHP
jgi:hypothetical protein